MNLSLYYLDLSINILTDLFGLTDDDVNMLFDKMANIVQENRKNTRREKR